MTQRLFAYGHEKRYSKSSFSKYFVSRLAYGLGTISSPLTRLIDLVIGVVVAPFALIAAFFGKGEGLSQFTFRQLKVGGVIDDLLRGLIKTINPWPKPTQR